MSQHTVEPSDAECGGPAMITAIEALRSASIGCRVRFSEERLSYTIQARGPRFIVCTKPFNPLNTVLYTVIDLEKLVRGPENLVLGAGAETAGQCEEMLARLEGRNHEAGFTSEVSRRRSIPLRVDFVMPPKLKHREMLGPNP